MKPVAEQTLSVHACSESYIDVYVCISVSMCVSMGQRVPTLGYIAGLLKKKMKTKLMKSGVNRFLYTVLEVCRVFLAMWIARYWLVSNFW